MERSVTEKTTKEWTKILKCLEKENSNRSDRAVRKTNICGGFKKKGSWENRFDASRVKKRQESKNRQERKKKPTRIKKKTRKKADKEKEAGKEKEEGMEKGTGKVNELENMKEAGKVNEVKNQAL